MPKLTRREGGCHCGAVRFAVDLPDSVEVENCNCSICAMSGNMAIIVPERRFRLLRGEEHLRRYTFHTGVAQHLFCGRCGVKSYYIPRSNPDGVAVTYRCIDDWRTLRATIHDFDGVNWEDNAAAVRHKSLE
jgi:hypothetical protein